MSENPYQQQPPGEPTAPQGGAPEQPPYGQPPSQPGAPAAQPYEQQHGQPYGQPYGQPQSPPYGQQPPQGYAPYTPYPQGYGYNPDLDPQAKSRLAAGLLGILLGSLGIHRFYLGYTGLGITMLLLSILSLGFLAPLVAIWGLVEGILYLTARQGSYAVDSTGRPLRS